MRDLEKSVREFFKVWDSQPITMVGDSVKAMREALKVTESNISDHKLAKQAEYTLHISDKPLHHYALVLRDLDKTIDGWCEEPEFYLDGEQLYSEQTEQVPVGVVEDDGYLQWDDGPPFEPGTKLYAATVRTKDLTDDEIRDIAIAMNVHIHYKQLRIIRAAIAADRKLNNV
ncbi:hypothetical protein [Flavobacterium sp.]|jgi:hypothetical protein|uniref:hypothetical protein n=1 Tax=Flavobacterium sp. TaxID=239 RepID=UPI0037C01056